MRRYLAAAALMLPLSAQAAVSLRWAPELRIALEHVRTGPAGGAAENLDWPILDGLEVGAAELDALAQGGTTTLAELGAHLRRAGAPPQDDAARRKLRHLERALETLAPAIARLETQISLEAFSRLGPERADRLVRAMEEVRAESDARAAEIVRRFESGAMSPEETIRSSAEVDRLLGGAHVFLRAETLDSLAKIVTPLAHGAAEALRAPKTVTLARHPAADGARLLDAVASRTSRVARPRTTAAQRNASWRFGL